MPQFTEMRRPALWAGRRERASRVVVVGYDGSEAAQRALRRAAEAAGSGGSVVVVTATQRPASLAFEADADATVAEPSRLLEEAAAELDGHDVRVSTRLEDAEPAEALADAARDVHAALIVVGARGDSYPARVLRGSVGARLIARAPCDLFIAR